MDGLRFILPYFKRHWLMILGGFMALIICDLGQLWIPTILGAAIDLLGSPSLKRLDLLRPMLHIFGLAVAVALLRYAWRRAIIGFSRLVEREMRGFLYRRMVRLSPRWHQEQKSGDLMALATNDIESVRMAISFGLISVVDTVVMGLTALAFMVNISGRLTLWAMAPMPAITLVTWFLGRRFFDLTLDAQNTFGQLTEVVREQISGLKVIRAMALTPLALAETEAAGKIYLKKNVRLAALSGTFFPFLNLMGNFGVALILYFGGGEAIGGNISTGDFVAFISYMGLLIWPMMALGMMFGILQQGLASLTRLKRVFVAENGESEDGGEQGEGLPLPSSAPSGLAAEIKFEDITFRYPGRQEDALNRLTLTLPPDRVTALTGPVGSGKSTMAALILGLRRADSGLLEIAGRPIGQWPPHRLRALFGYVPQDAFMFTGTIFENLAFGKPEATENEVLAAAETAGLAPDLARFPEGLHTLVGERGLTLSGGQRQRLALARALILDPPFLILDDAFSAVDQAVEEEILGRLLAARRGRGGLLISHRLSTLARADHIAVLEQGRVSAQGPAEELLADEGYFKRLSELAAVCEKDESHGPE